MSISCISIGCSSAPEALKLLEPESPVCYIYNKGWEEVVIDAVNNGVDFIRSCDEFHINK